MKKIRGFNLVFLATGPRNVSRDSDVPGMKNVEAFRPKCRCRHSAYWLCTDDSRWLANQRIFGRGKSGINGRLRTGVVASPTNPLTRTYGPRSCISEARKNKDLDTS